MASFSVEDFVGNGVLKDLLPTLLEEGWDDVPTLKVMNSEDMDAIKMTQQQKEAVEIRTYLHDRSLMQYGDRLESSGKCLPELLSLSVEDLTAQFHMKRGHIARFKDRNSSCADPLIKKSDAPSPSTSIKRTYQSNSSKRMQSMRSRTFQDKKIEEALSDFKIEEGYVFKGIVAAEPAGHRACACVQPPPIVDKVAPYSAIENISIQKLTPEYKIGMERLVKTKTPPMKASALWQNKPAIILCIRRPGAEAHQLYTRKPVFDALGFQLFAVIHEHIESEVKDFWPRYWGGTVIFDHGRGFFKALGGGKLMKDKFLSGFLFNPRAIANYKRAKAMGVKQNFNGEGEIKGGLFILGTAKSGIAYQFIERNFGDWAPLSEVINICTKLQSQSQVPGSSIETSQ
ncbi:Redox-regulatory protein-like protein, partial [Cucurbita argyrosperma subsp. argyrosperma]